MAQVPKGKNKNKRRSKNEENNRKSEVYEMPIDEFMKNAKKVTEEEK